MIVVNCTACVLEMVKSLVIQMIGKPAETGETKDPHVVVNVLARGKGSNAFVPYRSHLRCGVLERSQHLRACNSRNILP